MKIKGKWPQHDLKYRKDLWRNMMMREDFVNKPVSTAYVPDSEQWFVMKPLHELASHAPEEVKRAMTILLTPLRALSDLRFGVILAVVHAIGRVVNVAIYRALQSK